MGRCASMRRATSRHLVGLLVLTVACTHQGEAPEIPDPPPVNLAPPAPVLPYQPATITSLEEEVVSIVGPDAVPVQGQSDPALEWAAVDFELPDGYHLLKVSVQGLSAIDRPGSHIGGDWHAERRDGYEIRIRPDLAGAEQEVWIISDSHQIGVSLTSPPRTHVELSMEDASDLVQQLAIRLADELQS